MFIFIKLKKFFLSLERYKAKIFLTAHEQDPIQPQKEKEMDLFNNNKGLDYAQNEIKKNKEIELDQTEKAALQALRDHQLKVLVPSKSKIPEGYYSQ